MRKTLYSSKRINTKHVEVLNLSSLHCTALVFSEIGIYTAIDKYKNPLMGKPPSRKKDTVTTSYALVVATKNTCSLRNSSQIAAEAAASDLRARCIILCFLRYSLRESKN